MTTTATPSASTTLVRRDWAVLFVLCGAIFLEGIDLSMMGVALPAIRAELGLSTTSLQWVVSAYVLGYGGFVLFGGRAADLLGRRRMFVGWLAVFVAFSGLGGVAGEGWMLLVARFVTGVAAAFMTPAGLSIITTRFAEGPRRNRALLVYAGTAAGGFSLGMVVGGLLTGLHWRWVFFAPVLLASLILLAAVRLLPAEPRPVRAAGGFDLVGAFTLTGSMLLLVYGVVTSPDVPVARTVAVLAASLVLLVGFVAIERRAAAPLIRFGILRSGPLVRANLGAMLLVGSFVGFQFVAVLYLQEHRGWSEVETGLALMVIGLDAILAPTLTPKLVARFGNVPVIFAGLVLAAVAHGWYRSVGLNGGYLLMLPGFVVLGIGFALAYGPLTIAATDKVSEHEQGLASGILTTSFQFGSALGLAVVAAVLAASGFRAALLVPVAAAVLGVLATTPDLLATRRSG